jgi:hypothetical protein
MPKQISQQELDVVVQAVADLGSPLGAAGDVIGASLTTKLPRRTLQRRLALLVRQRRLAIEGRGRGS